VTEPAKDPGTAALEASLGPYKAARQKIFCKMKKKSAAGTEPERPCLQTSNEYQHIPFVEII